MDDFLNADQIYIRDLQAFHEALDREKAFDLDMLRNVAYLSEEVGEVVSAIRRFEEAEGPSVEEARAQLGEELADCLAYIVKLANYGGIDLQGAYLGKMKRNLTRVWHGAFEGKGG